MYITSVATDPVGSYLAEHLSIPGSEAKDTKSKTDYIKLSRSLKKSTMQRKVKEMVWGLVVVVVVVVGGKGRMLRLRR